MDIFGKGVSGMNKFLRYLKEVVLSRLVITVLLVAVQAFLLFSSFYWLSNYWPGLSIIMNLLSVFLVIYIMNNDMNPAFKLSWIIPICIFPLFGGLLYLYVEGNFATISLKKTVNRRIEESKPYLQQDGAVRKSLTEKACSMSAISRYVEEAGGLPTYANTKVTYFPDGKTKFADLLQELEKAEKFIFLEYFIIYEGSVWESLRTVLKRKIDEGVEVKLMYDGTCAINGLPKGYDGKLRQEGFDVRVFLPALPIFSTHQNNRDHRKILVIDGKIAYNGGINLADEYANLRQPHGYWKDTAVKLEGEAVRSFTVMFLQLWYAIGPESIKNYIPGDYLKYLPDYPKTGEAETPVIEGQGYVMPYGDGPNSHHRVAENVYLDMMNRANHYIHIMTPYFINDDQMISAFKYAAERGTDVKLIVPHIPDKQMIFDVTRTYYPVLLKAGVRVYEYTPGFVHAKCLIADDNKAVVGSINMDYRSLYHHFECATYIYRNPVIAEIETDFQEMLKVCQEVTMEYYKKIPAYHRLLGQVLKLFAPLL